MPATFSARRTGSAWPFARTRTAWSRGRAPAAIRRAMSAAIQSASSEPVANASSRTGAAAGSRRSAFSRFADAGPDLEPVRVVEPDEPIRRVEDRAERSVVPSQHDGPRAPVARLEVEDVVDRRAAERVDRLVVVADDRDVAMRLGEQRHELRLRPVRVLELVDQDVPEAAGDRRPGRRRLAHEAQGERHLVAEIDEPVRGQQVLVAGERPGQLRLPASVLARAPRPPHRPSRPRRRLGQRQPPPPRPGRRRPRRSPA